VSLPKSHRIGTSFSTALLFAAGTLSAQAQPPQFEEFGVNVSAGLERQSFSYDDGNIYSLIASPYYARGDWLFIVDLPWQRLEGTTYQVRRPTIGGFCNAVTNNGRVPPGLQGRVPDPEQSCNQDETVEVEIDDEQGVGDIGLLASFGRPLDTDNWPAALATGSWFGAVTAGYLADNADADTGLGSGTEDIYLEGFVSGDFDHFSTALTAGYNNVIGGELDSFYDDYFYTSAELSTPRQETWVVGANGYFQQADLSGADDVTKLTLFAEWEAREDITLRVDYSRYGSGDFYPENSAGATVSFNF